MHRIFTNDVVKLKANQRRIGHVQETHLDVETHFDQPLAAYSDIQRHPQIPPYNFDHYLASGVPPKGAVVVEWLYDQDPNATHTSVSIYQVQLIPEAEVEAVDRELCVGDVVRKTTDDTISGVVIARDIRCSLLEPVDWTQDQQYTGALSRTTVQNIDARNLVRAKKYNLDDFIFYESWVGE